MVIDIAALKAADLAATPGPDLRSKALVGTGNVAKHFHARSDEIQYTVKAGGSAWLCGCSVERRPGLPLVVPKGTAHVGTEAASSRFKAPAMKIPPQAAGYTTRVGRRRLRPSEQGSRFTMAAGPLCWVRSTPESSFHPHTRQGRFRSPGFTP